MKKQPVYRVSHPIGSLVSTMRRFASRVHYEAAVRAEYISRPPHRQLPADFPLGESYSFHNQWVDTELLFLHQPGGSGRPSGNTSRGIDIPYYYTGEMTLDDFKIYYTSHVGSTGQIESPGNSPKGEKDKSGAYRAVYKVRGFVDDYAGFITNPPYPARKRTKRINQMKWLLPALLGLATGLAAVPLLRALRAQSEE